MASTPLAAARDGARRHHQSPRRTRICSPPAWWTASSSATTAGRPSPSCSAARTPPRWSARSGRPFTAAEGSPSPESRSRTRPAPPRRPTARRATPTRRCRRRRRRWRCPTSAGSSPSRPARAGWASPPWPPTSPSRWPRRGIAWGSWTATSTGPTSRGCSASSSGRRSAPSGGCSPLEAYGVKLMSLGFIVERDAPAIWRGPIIMKIVTAVPARRGLGRPRLLPGGHARPAPATPSSRWSRPPTCRGRSSSPRRRKWRWATRSAAARCSSKVNVPVLGVVENMSGFTCPHCGEHMDLFPTGGGDRLSARARRAGAGADPDAGPDGRPGRPRQADRGGGAGEPGGGGDVLASPSGWLRRRARGAGRSCRFSEGKRGVRGVEFDRGSQVGGPVAFTVTSRRLHNDGVKFPHRWWNSGRTR